MKLYEGIVCALCISLCLDVVPPDVAATAWLDVLDENANWLCMVYGDPYEVYVWIFPDTSGVICSEFQFNVPDNVTVVSTEINPAYSSEIGTRVGPPGVTICFQECQRDPFWIIKYQCTLPTRCALFHIINHEIGGDVRVSSCAVPDSLRSAYYSEWGYSGPLCLCPSTEESSWGAIKGMYK